MKILCLLEYSFHVEGLQQHAVVWQKIMLGRFSID